MDEGITPEQQIMDLRAYLADELRKHTATRAEVERLQAIVDAVTALADTHGAWKGDKHIRVPQRNDGIDVIRSAVWVRDLQEALAVAPLPRTDGPSCGAGGHRLGGTDIKVQWEEGVS